MSETKKTQTKKNKSTASTKKKEQVEAQVVETVVKEAETQIEVEAAAEEIMPETPVAPVEEKKAEKIFDLNTPIRCKSVRQSNMFYQSKVNASMGYVWSGFGDIRELPYQEIMSMKASRSKFLYEPWIIIEDDDLLQKPEFKGDFENIYALYKEFDNPKQFFDQDASAIEKKLKDMPNGLKELIIHKAGEFIADGTLDRMSVINVLDRAFGTNLKMLMM